ncbi:MAPEG family protein [Sphingobium algorifonticola]|uniref:MAPEG family protein n=1 Tax=Sphingobium algorifonticola TaxID=2008318 RepID=A0A437J6X8_9SPHN|nr:MAPEG family protein [Sphingobium algorifonticola]RVT40824.1 MAPEG family protein [Sphingobium algorifonticola]
MTFQILAPAAALAMWSMIMLLWLVATRLPAMAKLKLKPENIVGGRGQDLDKVVPPKVAWKSHNYAHLMEQPTLFYPVVIMLALMGQGEGLNLWLAWAYTGLRIAHSLWQALVNTIPVRLLLFVLSTTALFGLCLHALIAALHMHP